MTEHTGGEAPERTLAWCAPLLLLFSLSQDRFAFVAATVLFGALIAVWNVRTASPTPNYGRTIQFILVVSMASAGTDTSLYVAAAIIAVAATALFGAVPRISIETGIVILFFASLLSSTLLRMSLGGALRELAPIAAASIPVYFFMNELASSERPRLWRTYFALCATEVVIAVTQLLSIPIFPAPKQYSRSANSLLGDDFDRAAGSLGHPLLLGMFLAVGVAAALWVGGITGAPRRFGLVALYVAGLVAADARAFLALSLILILVYPVSKSASAVMKLSVAWFVSCLVLVIPLTNATSSDSLSNLTAQGSFSHRFEVLRSLPRLVFEQELLHTIFGGGAGSVPLFFSSGLFAENDGSEAVDNQFVYTLIVGGFWAVTLLAIIILVSLLRRGSQTRATVAVVIASFFVFDPLAWPATACLCFLVLGDSSALGRKDGAGQEIAAATVVSPKDRGAAASPPAGR